MAPPLPPPGVPARAGLAPIPIASLEVKTLLRIVHDTPMLDTAPPLEHTLARSPGPPKVLLTTYTGRSWNWSNTRMAAPPTSGPVGAHRLEKNRELTTLSRPPRTHTAPPPSYSVSELESPSTKVRFWSVSRGWSWSLQWGVVHTRSGSQVFM